MSGDAPDNGLPDVRRLAAVVAVGCAVFWLLPRPDAVTDEGWRLLGVFSAAIAGLILRPLPGGAVIFLVLVAAVWTDAMSLEQALSGFATPAVWLVVGALLIAHVLIETSLARRVALLFVRFFGATSSGVAYALILSDLSLATMIPSNTSRAGGVIMPITRSLAELYGSNPGATAKLLGTFLMVAVYQGEAVASATFLTGQAGNFIAVELAETLAGYEMSWARWAAAGIVPGLISVAGLVWIVSKLLPPDIRSTPHAREFAQKELRKLGRMGSREWTTLTLVAVVCGLWTTSNLHGIPVALASVSGACVLVVTGILTWRDAIRQHTVWDIMIWYGGVITLGRALSDAGVPRALTDYIGQSLGEMPWLPMLAIAVPIYFFAHYGLASITMHFLTLLPVFLLMLLDQGAPTGLAVYLFSCLGGLSAGLTHYGTVPSPIFYSQGYASFRQWWAAGFVVALWNLIVWCSIGSLWWKVLGIW
ncbi:MAG: DASS family sodium-coupled anion symporter [Bryobacterales bacterium]|nr:DASS family sodium-coupled anion symporter [Bryobacterales bacterium]